LRFHIKTLHGLEQILADEAKELGATNIQVKKRAINCEGDEAFMYRANLGMRVALKIMVPIYDFTAKNEKELYQQVLKHDWSRYLNEHDKLAIDHTINSDYFKHSKYASLKIKDAIVDQFRNRTGYRPDVDVKYPDVRFDVYGYNERFTISLNSSGDPLNRRGYRELGHEAPLNEVLAAGMLKLSGWTPDLPLIDPMCGSGTLLIEAAMMATNMPPQHLRKEFGFKRWRSFQPMLWSRVQSEMNAKTKSLKSSIQGSDIDGKAVRLTQKSLRKLGLDRQVKLQKADFLTTLSTQGKGMIVTNPPYDERLELEDINGYYKAMSDTLKNKYPGFEAWILSSNMEALKSFKLSPQQKIRLYNGKLDCRFEQYLLY
jgi:putative N6-adenine-specific DNA methylase